MAKTKAQLKKIAQKKINAGKLIQEYQKDPAFGKKMAKLTGAMYLAMSVVDLCQQEVDHLTYNILIPSQLRKAIKGLGTACDRVIKAEEKNDLMSIEEEHFQQLADDDRLVKDLLVACTGLSMDSFTKVSATAMNLSYKEEAERNNQQTI